MMKFELVSFKLCPYVQRSVITLKYKNVPFEITYIDLEEPPEWFNAISPLGKVPVLKVDAKTVLFESAVINEFIDEVSPPSLHPKDPLQKAFERAWIEYGSELLMTNYELSLLTEPREVEQKRKDFFEDLKRLEGVVSSGPFFRGKEFSLVDAAYAPLFMRLFLSDKLNSSPEWSAIPKVRAWAERLMKVPAVRESVVPEFADLYREYCRAAGSALFVAA